MSANSTLIYKADLALSDLVADGGLLNDEQTSAFIRALLAPPTILRACRVVPMGGPTRQINKIGFGSRILHKATSNSALSEGNRSKPTTDQVKLSAQEVIAEVRLPYDVVEDNIERGELNLGGPNVGPQMVMGGLKDTLVNMIAERAALDLEELALLGDTMSGDPYLAMLDGWLAQCSSNVVDHEGAVVGRGLFKKGLQAMPDQYLRNRAAMRHYLSHDNETEYRDSIASRETAAGDAVVNQDVPVYAFGVPVEPVSMMPGDKGLFTYPQNLIYGIQRRITMEVDKDISARVFIIVVTARVDFKIEEETAVVLYDNIGTGE
jgi:hypothetical protein